MKKNHLSLLAAIIVAQLTWPGISLPVLLGPALLLGLEPLLPLTGWQYLATLLGSSLIGLVSGGYWLAAIIGLQFVLWFWVHRRQHPWLWAVSILLPLSLLVWQQPEKTYLTYLLSLASVGLQLLLYHTLTGLAQQKISQLQENHHYRRGAERLLTANTYAEGLELFTPILQALNRTMEQTYAIYQDIELLTRTNPNLPQPLAQRLLQAAQQIHQDRLQLQEWRKQQESRLQEIVARDAASLHTIYRWLATCLNDTAGKKGQHLRAVLDLSDDTPLTEAEQFPLANLLLFIGQQGLSHITDAEISVRFNNYLAQERMRIILTFAAATLPPSGEWPELNPCDLSAVSSYATQLNANCLLGITRQGEYIYVLELG